jgi:hypothetical protein
MRRYIKPGGLWVQWIQTYEFNDQLFLNILKALDVAFPHVSLYKAPEEPDIIIIASDQPVFQKGIGRFSTDSALVKEFRRIHRDPEFFGEQNFLFTSKMVKSLLDGVAPNSIFTPIVDNKAEEARFVHSQAHIVQVFDSCEVCWPEYLDSAENELRRPFRVKQMMQGDGDPYKKLALLAYLDKVQAQVDSAVTVNAERQAAQAQEASRAPADSTADSVAVADTTRPALHFMVAERSPEWVRFRMEYIEWIRGVPMEARDSNEVYNRVRDLVDMGAFPASFTDEFNILEVARVKDYPTAARLVADFYEKYEIKEMDEFFLRNVLLISLLAGEPELANAIYQDAIKNHESFFPVEKFLIEREIVKLRRSSIRK